MYQLEKYSAAKIRAPARMARYQLGFLIAAIDV